MAQRPEVKSLNDFVKIHGDGFTPFELWLTDELTDYLVVKRNTDKNYTSVVIDTDRENPVYGVKDNKLQLRFNGRFFIPSEDKNGTPLNLKPEQWVELVEAWFKDQELEVVIGDKAIDFIKFTAIIPVLDMPEPTPEAEETPEGEGEPEEEPESGEDEELKEFEQALGI